MRVLFYPLVSMFGILLLVGNVESRPNFYYAFSEKLQIKPNPKKILVKFRSELGNPSARVDAIKSRIQIQRGRLLSLKQTGAYQGIIFGQTSFSKEEITTISSMSDVEAALEVFETEDGTEMSYQNDICIQPKADVSTQEVREILSTFGITILQEKNFIIGKVGSGDDALEVANKIFETGKFEYVHPDFSIPIVRNQIPNDTYFGWQWNFRNIGQPINDGHAGTPSADIRAVDAWRAARGHNVVVAVLDEGVTNNHPDLPNTRQIRLNGSNFTSSVNANDPSPIGSANHGNACAGLIAATINNGVGVAGIAPRSFILPIHMIGATNANVAASIDFAWENGAQILSNSWGYGSANANLVPVIVDAINRALTLGRGGRGSLVIFAAGNTANHNAGAIGYIGFPANVAGVVTVGASDRNDRQANYSPTSPTTGKTIDLVAPSHRAYPSQIPGEDFEVWTLDIPGDLGYNPNQNNGEQLPASGSSPTWNNYTGRFGGTSAACPQVAGVAALILGFKPGLRRQEVVNILRSTADRVGPYTYTNGRSRELGFGRLNSLRAVRQAFPMVAVSTFAMK